MKNSFLGQALEIALNQAGENVAATAPAEVELIPAGGVVVGRDGRKWINDDPARIVAAFAANRAALPIDVEHATDLLGPQGLPAPAAGWIEKIFVKDGNSIWGRVSWNANGRKAVESREYRYLSPVLLYEAKTGRIAGITSAALTNQPNLFLSALNRKEDSNMLINIAKTLGLSETATEGEILAALNRQKTDLETARSTAPPLDKFVPRPDYETALNRATAAETALAAERQAKVDAEIETAIKGALEGGKITPATADYHKAQCRTEGGLDRFRAFCTAAPVIAPPSGLDGKKPEGGTPVLDDTQKALNAQLGISDEDFKKYNV